jgi:hypothetical protein
MVIRQSSVRFSIFVSVYLAVFGGYFIDAMLSKKNKVISVLTVSILVLGLGDALYRTISVNLNFINDHRYAVEKWMKKNIRPGSRIEYYSYLHYLPRFPGKTLHYRIKKNAGDIEKRKPDYIVLSSHYYRRFFNEAMRYTYRNYLPSRFRLDRRSGTGEEKRTASGRVTLTNKSLKFLKSDFPLFMRNLLDGKLKYTLYRKFHKEIKYYRLIRHARVSPEMILIFKRVE